jgi:hypothetical protein
MTGQAEGSSPRGPVRVEGPTSAGGAYSIGYYDGDRLIEIVEYDADGNDIMRIYCASPAGSPHGDTEGTTMPLKPIPKPPKAEAVLAALASKYQPGDAVSMPQIADVGDCSEGVAGRIRAWARSVGRWPYSEGAGGWVSRQKSRTRSKGKAAAGGS